MKKSKVLKKRIKKLVILTFYLNYHFFGKKTKELTNIQLSKELPFHPSERKKDQKDYLNIKYYKMYYHFLIV